MSIEQLNTTALGATDVTLMAAAIDKNSKGLAQITVSEYDTDAACVVKSGSVFECNGATFLVSGTDETPTGYSGISVSTAFYLYYDESEDEFTYLETAPTWSDSLQGWYNGNDRAFFSMYKDSTGLLYANKFLLGDLKSMGFSGIRKDESSGVERNINLKTRVLPLGTWNMDVDAQKEVLHGAQSDKIVMVFVTIISDYGEIRPYNATDDGQITLITSTHIYLNRMPGGGWDSSTYNDSTINRGWLTLVYEV